MHAHYFLAAFLVASATTACAFDATTDDAADTTYSATAPTAGTGVPPDTGNGPACAAELRLGENGEMIVKEYLCSDPQRVRQPDPPSLPTGPHELERDFATQSAR